jgi:hypothetical protein
MLKHQTRPSPVIFDLVLLEDGKARLDNCRLQKSNDSNEQLCRESADMGERVPAPLELTDLVLQFQYLSVDGRELVHRARGSTMNKREGEKARVSSSRVTQPNVYRDHLPPKTSVTGFKLL